ncbi:hypothetical protein AAVH_01305 [Aphelenchoides avenae]|nr:hypothetical protein AAVH_01305 [Aphelenchus avenae]
MDEPRRRRSPEPVEYRQPTSPTDAYAIPPRTSLMRRLQTSNYFWEPSTSKLVRPPEPYEPVMLMPSEPIPTSGILLDSDVPMMNSRLQAIRQNLNNLREYRLNMPSVDYFQTIMPPVVAPPAATSKPMSVSYGQYYDHPSKATLPSLADIRSRILNMHFNVERRTREIIDERRRERRANAQVRLQQSESAYMLPGEVPQEQGNVLNSWQAPTQNVQSSPAAMQQMPSQNQRFAHSDQVSAIPHPPSTAQPTVQGSVFQPPHQSQQAAPFTPVPQPTSSVPAQPPTNASRPEPVIAPSRRIVFADRSIQRENPMPDVKQSAASPAQVEPPWTEPKTQSELAKQQEQPSSYNRMLDLLRQKTYDVSTSSESDDDLLAKKTPAAAKPSTSGASKPTTFSTSGVSQTAKPTSASGLASATQPTSGGSRRLQLTKNDPADSDDDFFG